MAIFTRLFILCLCLYLSRSESNELEDNEPEICNITCPCEENSNPPFVTLPGPTPGEFYFCINGVAFPGMCNNGFHYSPECMVCQHPAAANAVSCSRVANCKDIDSSPAPPDHTWSYNEPGWGIHND